MALWEMDMMLAPRGCRKALCLVVGATFFRSIHLCVWGFHADLDCTAHLLGEDLYQSLTEYLNGHLAGVYEASKTLSGEALLSYYIKEWDRYTAAAKYINHVFRYLNRHWVKREIDEGKKNVFEIYTLHLVRWREVMFKQTQKAVMQAVLNLVVRQRNGETIEHSQIRSIVDSFCKSHHLVSFRRAR